MIGGVAPIDGWTSAHVVSGAILGAVRAPWWVSLGVLVAFEAVEAAGRKGVVGGTGLLEPESWSNIGADVLAGMAGWAATRVVRAVL